MSLSRLAWALPAALLFVACTPAMLSALGIAAEAAPVVARVVTSYAAAAEAARIAAELPVTDPDVEELARHVVELEARLAAGERARAVCLVEPDAGTPVVLPVDVGAIVAAQRATAQALDGMTTALARVAAKGARKKRPRPVPVPSSVDAGSDGAL